MNSPLPNSHHSGWKNDKNPGENKNLVVARYLLNKGLLINDVIFLGGWVEVSQKMTNTRQSDEEITK